MQCSAENYSGAAERIYMKYIEYLEYVAEAKNCNTFDEFLSDIGYGALVPYTPENWKRVCEIIFAVAHNDINSIIGALSARKFAIKYNIEERTVQRWNSDGNAPIHTIFLLGYAVIGDIAQIETL